jgi:hypothetical protein
MRMIQLKALISILSPTFDLHLKWFLIRSGTSKCELAYHTGVLSHEEVSSYEYHTMPHFLL